MKSELELLSRCIRKDLATDAGMYSGINTVAAACGVHRNTVYGWLERGLPWRKRKKYAQVIVDLIYCGERKRKAAILARELVVESEDAHYGRVLRRADEKAQEFNGC